MVEGEVDHWTGLYECCLCAFDNRDYFDVVYCWSVSTAGFPLTVSCCFAHRKSIGYDGFALTEWLFSVSVVADRFLWLLPNRTAVAVPLLAVSIVLIFFSTALLFLVYTEDPGILPRPVGQESVQRDEAAVHITSRDVLVNGVPMKMKYCGAYPSAT